MKKLALIGMVVAGLLLSTGVAWAKPTGMTKAEYRALMVRSEGLNQKYGLDKVKLSNVNQKLEEIGAWAVPSKQTVTKPLVSEKLSGLDLQPTSTATSGGSGFDWNDAGIGAALAFVGVLGIGAALTVRNKQHASMPHWPILH